MGGQGLPWLLPEVVLGGAMPVPNFLIVDDHPLFLEALKAALEVGYPGGQVDIAETISGALSLIERKKFSLVLLDLKMPDASGLEGLMHIRSACLKTPLAVISAMSEPEIIAKIKSIGAEGFINKSQHRLGILQAVADLLSGASSFPEFVKCAVQSSKGKDDDVADKLRQLTPQQFKVLNKVCEAKLNKQIAYELGVTETTVKAHITIIFKKLGVHSRTQAVLLMQRLRPELEDSKFNALIAAER
jgi:DNA-binding NarL/FixJ family response regulator